MSIIGQKILLDIDRKLRKSTEEAYRPHLDKQITILDLSYAALKASFDPSGEDTYTRVNYTTTLDLLRSSPNVRIERSLKSASSFIKDPDKRYDKCVFVEDPTYGVFLIGSNFTKLQRTISSALKGIDSIFGRVRDSGVIQTNVRHISSGTYSFTRSPLQVKILDILTSVPTRLRDPIEAELNKIYNSHTGNIEYSFKRPEVAKAITRNFGTLSVVVTLHTTEKSSSLARIEKEVETSIRRLLENTYFREQILGPKDSGSILKDIEHMLVSTLKTGKSESIKIGKQSTEKLKGRSSSSKTSGISAAKLRDTSGHFTNLVKLQDLINISLHDQIQKNMGNGNSTSILNYRTGRFAKSAKVEKMSMSREGNLTAFYTYMKYPYQTFEPGYAQGIPTSRNPRVLISKSIREVASKLIINKLKASII